MAGRSNRYDQMPLTSFDDTRQDIRKANMFRNIVFVGPRARHIKVHQIRHLVWLVCLYLKQEKIVGTQFPAKLLLRLKRCIRVIQLLKKNLNRRQFINQKNYYRDFSNGPNIRIVSTLVGVQTQGIFQHFPDISGIVPLCNADRRKLEQRLSAI